MVSARHSIGVHMNHGKLLTFLLAPGQLYKASVSILVRERGAVNNSDLSDPADGLHVLGVIRAYPRQKTLRRFGQDNIQDHPTWSSVNARHLAILLS